MIIDSHHHFWNLRRKDYFWLTPKLGPLYRNFLPKDLGLTLKSLGISKTILIQAAPTLAETKYLLKLAEQTDFVSGVVGWINMESKTAPDILYRLSLNARFRGIRPMLQDVVDPDWILNDQLKPVFQALNDLQLTFDALIFPQHLKNITLLAERFPSLVIVINHGAKPFIKSGCFKLWATEIKRLAENKNVYCKFSGLLTEAGTISPQEKIKPYIDHLFESFGADRLLWGSDWPVVTLSDTYENWFIFCKHYIAKHHPQALNAVFGETARKIYLKTFF